MVGITCRVPRSLLLEQSLQLLNLLCQRSLVPVRRDKRGSMCTARRPLLQSRTSHAHGGAQSYGRAVLPGNTGAHAHGGNCARTAQRAGEDELRGLRSPAGERAALQPPLAPRPSAPHAPALH